LSKKNTEENNHGMTGMFIEMEVKETLWGMWKYKESRPIWLCVNFTRKF